MERLGFLVGTWRGRGTEEYPTVDAAEYEEEMRFAHAGDDFLTYTQRAWSSASGATLHAESGFWRLGEAGALEIALAHPLGLTEISEGAVDGTDVHAASRLVGRTTTGAPVAAVVRSYRVAGDVLTYEIAMALDTVPLTHHLRATLQRTP